MNAPAATATILLIEDEQQIRRYVRAVIEAEGATVIEAETLRLGLRMAGEAHPDLVVLDLGLPDGDGQTFINDLRHWSDTPILVLSARTLEREKIAALDAGADDYLSKPFGAGELRARLRALLRRWRSHNETPPPQVCFGTIEVDFSRRLVQKNGVVVSLTPLEYRLLAALVAQPGKVLTQRTLLRKVWGPSHVESGHYLRVYVGKLRQKLEDDPTRPRFFQTETGIGYRFCHEESMC